MTEQLTLYSPFTFFVTSALTIWVFSLATSVFLRCYLPQRLKKCHFAPTHLWPKHQKNLLGSCQHSHIEDMLLFVLFLLRIANADLKASNLFGHHALPLAFGCVSSRLSFLSVHFIRAVWKLWPWSETFKICFVPGIPESSTLVPTLFHFTAGRGQM